MTTRWRARAVPLAALLAAASAGPLAGPTAAAPPAIGIRAMGAAGSGLWPGAGAQVGDVDGDGRDDLVQAGPGTGNGALRVQRSDGETLLHDAGFDVGDLAVPDTASALATSIRTGDFDADGRADVLVVRPGGAGSVWRSNGTALVRAPALEQGATGLGRASELLVADWNGDGRDDLLQVANGRGYFWLSQPAGGFSRTAGATYDATARGLGLPPEVQAGDFDADGRADLMQVANGRGYFWVGQAAGGFSRTAGAAFDQTALGIGGAAEVVVADLNGDGADDVGQLPGGPAGTAWLWPSTGSAFEVRARVTTQCAPPAAGANHLDLDGDGRADLLTIDDETATAFAWRGGPVPARGPLPSLVSGAAREDAIDRLQEQTLRCEGALRPLFGHYYPSESALEALSLWQRTGDPRHLETARRWLDVSHRRAVRTDASGLPNNGMLIVVDPTGPPECRDGCFGRDYQARQIYDLYAAWQILDDPTYLGWADDAADAMRQHVPRLSHAGFTLFAWNIDRRLGERDLPGWQTAIDPNQNAEIALAFALLRSDPASRYHSDPARRAAADDIVVNEVAASLTQQRHGDPSALDFGAIALSELRPDQYDTLYGSYTSWSWAWTAVRLTVPNLATAVQDAGTWLGTYPRGTEWGRFYQGPTYTTALTTISSAEEVWYRIPALVAAGSCDERALLDEMLRQEWADETPAGMWDNGSMLTAQLALMGIPSSVYLDGTCG